MVPGSAPTAGNETTIQITRVTAVRMTKPPIVALIAAGIFQAIAFSLFMVLRDRRCRRQRANPGCSLCSIGYRRQAQPRPRAYSFNRHSARVGRSSGNAVAPPAKIAKRLPNAMGQAAAMLRGAASRMSSSMWTKSGRTGYGHSVRTSTPSSARRDVASKVLVRSVSGRTARHGPLRRLVAWSAPESQGWNRATPAGRLVAKAAGGVGRGSGRTTGARWMSAWFGDTGRIPQPDTRRQPCVRSRAATTWANTGWHVCRVSAVDAATRLSGSR